MAAPFAAVEARINAAVVRHLANATAIFGGGAQVDGGFGNAYAEALGVSGSRPVFGALTSALSGVVVGNPVTISGIGYVVAEIHPDGTGMTQLVLEKS